MLNFIKCKFETVKKHKKYIIIFSLCYLLGFILSIFLSHKNSSNAIFFNVFNYHVIIFNLNVSVISVFFKCFFAGVLLTVTVFAFGFSKYTVPLEGIIIFYRGITLGSALIYFYQISQISGVVVFFILTIPTHVAVTAGLIFSSALNFEIQNIKDLKKKTLAILKNCLISVFFTFIASLYLLILLVTVIRPINLIV